MDKNVAFGTDESVLFIEVSFYREVPLYTWSVCPLYIIVLCLYRFLAQKEKVHGGSKKRKRKKKGVEQLREGGEEGGESGDSGDEQQVLFTKMDFAG